MNAWKSLREDKRAAKLRAEQAPVMETGSDPSPQAAVNILDFLEGHPEYIRKGANFPSDVQIWQTKTKPKFIDNPLIFRPYPSWMPPMMPDDVLEKEDPGSIKPGAPVSPKLYDRSWRNPWRIG